MELITEIAPISIALEKPSSHGGTLDNYFPVYAAMHGSTYIGDSETALRQYAIMLKEEIGKS